MNKILNVAVVGIGRISEIYIKNMTERYGDAVKVRGYYDIISERAEKMAQKYSAEKVYSSLNEVLEDSQVDIVLNLTRPVDHYDIISQALSAGKHVYTEKPLTESFEKSEELVLKAETLGLYLASAPDTFLGSGIQTCKELVDCGIIGRVTGACAQMVCSGWEYWHPDPEFYYAPGGGPLKDMGPYYLTALTYLIGRVDMVAGMAKASYEERTIKNGYKLGKVMKVEVPTWINSILQFDNGAQVSLFTSFDCWFEKESRIELYGTEGTLLVPDPNWFNGEIKLMRKETDTYETIPLNGENEQNLRGIGIYDMAKAINEGRPCAANGRRALHVMDIIECIEMSYSSGCFTKLKRT